ncbi:hypothetical protein SASPL_156367 [Salvia splendens]|uniref:Uncharacterized protein n=1 Tax=Salvia splendens TaxID=180675 RepID=A0A8X8VWV0_SALSN|nr:hypothetical protein SASPL_156367 [Salvia splendens]
MTTDDGLWFGKGNLTGFLSPLRVNYGVVMIMATAVVGLHTATGKSLLRLGATSYYSDLSAERLNCSTDPSTTTSSSSSINFISSSGDKSRSRRRPHSIKALRDPHPCLSDPDHLVDAVLLLQKSMLEKQWNLAPKTEVTCSGTSARRRRLESTKRVEKPIMNPELLRRGYVKSDQLLTHAQVVQLSHKIKAGLALEERRARLKQRLGCEPSDEQLAASLRMSRANLQSKMIECSLAREKLAMSNIRLVMSIAQRYDNMGAEMPDLIQAGLAGLRSLIPQGIQDLYLRRIAESLNMTERKVRNATEAVSKVFSLDREAYPSLNVFLVKLFIATLQILTSRITHGLESMSGHLRMK